MHPTLSHTVNTLPESRASLPRHSHIHKKGELKTILSQGSRAQKPLGSANVQPSVPGTPISSVTMPEDFSFHAENIQPNPSVDNATHVYAAEPAEPKKGFFARAKDKVKGWFSKKEEKKVESSPSSGSEVVQVGNKGFEVRQGKWYNKIFSHTVGRLSSIVNHTLLTLKPQDGLKNPDIGKIKDILARYSDVNWDTDHTIYLGHTDRWDQVKKMFSRRKGFMNTLLNISVTPLLALEGVVANLSRADHYNPITKSLSIYSPNKWVAAHEMGHAADFAQPWDLREMEKRVLPIFGTLYTEKIASTNAISRTHNAEEKKEAEKVLYPAYGSYVGGMIFAPIAYVLSRLGITGKSSSKTIDAILKTIAKVVSIPTVLGILAGHINARLPNSLKFKLFDKKNAPTAGDTHISVPVESAPAPIVAPVIDPTWVASMEDRNKQLSDTVDQISQNNQQLIQEAKKLHEENERLQKEVFAIKKADAEDAITEDNTETNNAGDEKIDVMKKDADIVRAKLTNTLPTDYEVSWEELGKGYKGMQKLTASHKDKENKNNPEIMITVYEPGKVRVRYNPQKNHGSVAGLNYSYYMGETTIDGLDGYLSAIAGVVSPVDSAKPDFNALEVAGLKKEGEDGDKHGYRHAEGPFGARDQNKEHHNKEKAKRSKK